MADDDLSDAQWLELYRHLLVRLGERGYVNVRSAVEAAAFAPVFEDTTPEEDEELSRSVRGEVGKRILRRRRPAEVFAAAVGVLHTRLVEVPAVASAIADRFGRSARDVQFRVDHEEQFAPTEMESISLERLTVSVEEEQALHTAFERVGVDPRQIKHGHDGKPE